MNNTTLHIENGFNEDVELDINYHDEEDYQVFIKGVNVTYLLNEETLSEVVKQIAKVEQYDHNNCDGMEIIRDSKY